MPVMSSRNNTYNRPGYFEDSSANHSSSGPTSPGEVFVDYLYAETTNRPKPIDYTAINPQTFYKLLIHNRARSATYLYKAYGFPENRRRWTEYRRTPYPSDKGWPNPYSTGGSGGGNWSMTDGRALEKLLEQVRGTHANLSVDFAEGRQTLAMLAKAVKVKQYVFEFARDIVKSRKYRKIRPGPTQGQRRLDYVNGKWLEYRYGWMPLVSSLYDLTDALRKERVSGPVVLKARSGRKAQLKYKDARAGNLGTVNTLLTIDQSQRSEYCGRFQLQPGYSFADFTSLNPALVAWELLPFSFIADWFLGIGQCLENWENYFLYRNAYQGGYLTRTTKEDRVVYTYEYASRAYTYFPDGSISNSGYFLWNDTQTSTIFQRYKQRYPLASLPTPNGPRVKANLQPKQFMDIAALVSQYVKKFR